MAEDEYLTIVHPAAEGETPELLPEVRLSSLQGVVVGLIDNARHNSDRFMQTLEQLLAEAGVTRVIVKRKPNPSIPLDASTLDELAAECDALVHGVAD